MGREEKTEECGFEVSEIFRVGRVGQWLQNLISVALMGVKVLDKADYDIL